MVTRFPWEEESQFKSDIFYHPLIDGEIEQSIIANMDFSVKLPPTAQTQQEGAGMWLAERLIRKAK